MFGRDAQMPLILHEVTEYFFFCLSILVRLADAEDEMRGLRQQLQENQQGDYQEIGELRKK